MYIHDNKKTRGNGFSRIAFVTVLFLVIAIAGFLAYQFIFISQPVLKGTDGFTVLPAAKTIVLQGKHIKSLEVSVNQGDRKIELLKGTPGGVEKTYTLQIKPKDLALSDGIASIQVRAESGMFKKLSQDIKATIDTVPPALNIIKSPEVVSQGGAGFVVLMAKDTDSVFVKLEDRRFPAFRKPSEQSAQDGKASYYYVFFPIPYDVKENALLYAVAQDAAGNQNVQAIRSTIKPVSYRLSSIAIDDKFIDTVAASLLNETSISDHASAFKKVNEDLRAKALEKLMDISKNTDPKILWNEAFLQLRNGQVMAVYGDKRTYQYKGNTISHSVHLGYDLASNAHAPVEAANSGIIRFAGDLSIYGNTVVIDHGMGLMSLYGHLSSISVSEGQPVSRGDIIGKTGATGLAGGDHLHFGMLLHGYEVSPLFWWDLHWIRVNVLDAMEG